MQQDLSAEQARRWVSREIAKLDAYDEVFERLAVESRIMATSHESTKMFPVSAKARQDLIGLLEKKLAGLRTRLH